MPKLPVKYFKTVTEYAKYNWSGAIDKLYPVVKTVTKDFTRTDPVYVRIGDDGEPEIHYTMTKANGDSYFAGMDLGNATLYVHNGEIVTNFITFARWSKAARLMIDDTSNGTNFVQFAYGASIPFIGDMTIGSNANCTSMFQDWKYSEYPRIQASGDGIDLTRAFAFAGKATVMPASDLSGASSLASAWDGGYPSYKVPLTEFHAYGMRVSFDLHYTNLTHDAILEVFNNLGSGVAEGTTLTLGSDKLALMSDEEKKIATDKKWTLA